MREIADPVQAAQILRTGGVLAYPTEAVFGLGCDPANNDAIARLLKLKGRPQQKGLICIAADFAQVAPWLDLRHRDQIDRAKQSWPGPITWILKARAHAPAAVCREDGTIAVRVTAHPPAIELCRAFAGPIVSTSANTAGAPPARGHAALAHYFGTRIEGVMIGPLGDATRPTQIFSGATGERLRS